MCLLTLSFEKPYYPFGAKSRRGTSKLVIFTGTIISVGFQRLLEIFLIPFLRDHFGIITKSKWIKLRLIIGQ